MKKYFLKIFGCQMNYSDAERIATILEKHKFKPAASIEAADLVVFVTCGVRQSAEDRVYGQINNLRKKFPKKKVILTGCLAHRKDVRRRLKGRVNLFCEIKDFPKEIKKILNIPLRGTTRRVAKYQIQNTKNALCDDYLKITPKYTNNYTVYIPIMTGCDNFCAYCVVPSARGREYSRPAEDILREARHLVKKGYKEIVLLGQNVNSYRSGKFNFPGLLRLIEKITGKFWITFLTSHPKDMSDELIKTIAKSKKICEYVSLPAQSGDNGILRKMNRRYTTGHYKNIVKKIRSAYKKHKPGIPPAISTDIIVGFPGETRKQFENTAKLLKEMKFDMAFIAQYSPRPETAAFKMKDNVSKAEKVRREKVLTKILKETALENNKKYVGKTVEVLADKEGLPAEASAKVGRTRTRKKVLLHSDLVYRQAGKKIPVGSFVKVKITKAKAFGLEGELEGEIE